MKTIDLTSIHITQTNWEERKIATLFALDPMAETIANGLSTDGDQPNIKQDLYQSQARQAIKVAQHCLSQVKTYLISIHNQMRLSLALELSFQHHPSNRVILFPHPNSWIVQQLAQTSGAAEQPSQTGDLPNNTAQINRASLVDANNHPDDISYLGNPSSRTQYPNPAKPGMIEAIDRKEGTTFFDMVGTNRFYRSACAYQFSFYLSVR